MRALRLILLVILGLWAVGCSHAFEYEADFHGRVLDESTKEPIKGVVVLATWNDDNWMGIAGPTTQFYTAAETLTDEKGEFTIDGRGIKIFSSIGPMSFSIFKAGYEATGGTRLYYEKGTSILPPGEWDGKRAILYLRKLSMEERRTAWHPDIPYEADFEDVKLMLFELNRDYIAIGVKPSKRWKGITYETPNE